MIEPLKFALAQFKLIAAQDQGCGGTVTATEAWYAAQSLAHRAAAALASDIKAAENRIVFKIHKTTPPRGATFGVNDIHLPWVYDQDPSSGSVASMWVTPFYGTPPAAQRAWVGLTDAEIEAAFAAGNGTYAGAYRAIEAKLKEKNT